MEFAHVAEAEKYARHVIDGKIPAYKYHRLACQRFIDDKKRSRDAEWPYKFDKSKAERAIRFIEKLPHTKGKWAAQGKKLILEPWQKFIVANIFGWVGKKGFEEKGIEPEMRRYRKAYLLIPRKNGKSMLAAAIGDYMLLADNEHGAEVYCGATNEEQAGYVFEPAKKFIDLTPALKEYFGAKVMAKSITVPTKSSWFKAVIGKPGDGQNPHCGIVDEYHEHDSDALVETFETGMGSRLQPLLLAISTAGDNIAGPCYAMHKDAMAVLEGTLGNDAMFCMMFSIDEDDDWTDPENLKKANPNYGVSVTHSFLLQQLKEAKLSSRKQNAFKIKNLNLWVNSRSAWMNMLSWNNLADKNLAFEDFEGDSCWIGLDLASRLDIAAVYILFRKYIDSKHHYYGFGRFYLPEKVIEAPNKRHYQGWVYDNHLIATDGDIIDYNQIRNDIMDIDDRFQIEALGYDPHDATHFCQQLQDEGGLNVIAIPQRANHLSQPMKDFEALVVAGRMHHGDNPCMNWMMSNVTCKEFADNTIMPRKDSPDQKIDGPVAAIMALKMAQMHEDTVISYEKGGIFL